LENDDQVFAQQEDLDQKLDDAFDTLAVHTRTLDDLQGRVPRSPPPFSVGQLSDAMKQQFATITNDRDKLAARIESSTSKQLKINKAHDDDVHRLQDEVRALKATITRLELAPPAPLSLNTHPASVSQHHPYRSVSRSPTPRVHSRSRSPSENRRDAKRSRHTWSVIEMGPIKSLMASQLQPVALFDLHLETAIPKYVRPEDYEVRREGDYLLVRLPSAGDARALIKAWTAHKVDGYSEIRVSWQRDGNRNAAASGSAPRASSGQNGGPANHNRNPQGSGGGRGRSYNSRRI
jgi:hypothetical protein